MPYHILFKLRYPKRLDLILLQTVSYLKCLSFKIQKWVNKIIDSLNVGSFLAAFFFNMMLDKSFVVIYRRICIIIFSFLFNIYSFPITVLNIIDSSWIHKNVLENQKKKLTRRIGGPSKCFSSNEVKRSCYLLLFVTEIWFKRFWYNTLLSKCYGTPPFLGDCGLTSVNKGIVNKYAWNDFYNKKDSTFHSKLI